MWTMPFAPLARTAVVTRRLVRTGLFPALAIVFALAGANAASATGYWNLPGNMCQWCGCGMSGGYHASFVLGPPTGGCLAPWNETRLPNAPNPYGCAPYCGGSTNGGYGPPMERIEGPPAQLPAPQEPETPEAHRRPLIFQAPVQY